MKTLEFKIELTEAQETLINSWFPRLKKVWNLGLTALEQFDQFRYYDKVSKTFTPCCPMPWEMRKCDWDGKYYPCSPILDSRSRWYQKQMPEHIVPAPSEAKGTRGWYCKDGGSAYSCPVKITWEPEAQTLPVPGLDAQETWLDNSSYFSLCKLNSKEFMQSLPHRYPGVYTDKEVAELLEIPTKYRHTVFKGLATAWQEYIKSRSGKGKIKRGKPLYKRRRDRVNTLANINPPKPTKKTPRPKLFTEDYNLKLPGLGEIKVVRLRDRWKNHEGDIPPICTYKITHRPSGWYIQLTGEIVRSMRLHKKPKPVVGLDPGILYWLTTHTNEKYANPQWYARYEDKIANKQQQINHKLDHTLILWLNRPERTIEDVSAIIPIASEKFERLRTAKTPKQIVEVIGSSRFQRLRYSEVLASNRVAKLQHEVAKLRERESQARKAYAHKTATWLVRKYQTIICEDGEQAAELRQQVHADLAKRLADTGHGDFFAKCEARTAEPEAEEAGRQFIRYPASFTTQQCPVCDHRQDVGINQPDKIIECENCGYTAGFDQRPGILMLIQAYEQGIIAYEDLDVTIKTAIALRQKRLNESDI